MTIEAKIYEALLPSMRMRVCRRHSQNTVYELQGVGSRDWARDCMTFTLHVTPTRFITIDSLRLNEGQLACPLSGTVLLEWVQNLCDMRIVRYVKLEDEAMYKVPRSQIHIDLTVFRKFTSGMGWYESRGFMAETADENKRYQRSFIHLEKTSISNLTTVLYLFLKPFMTLRRGSIRVSNAAHDDSYLTTWGGRYLLECMNRLTPYPELDDDVYYDLISAETNEFHDIRHTFLFFLLRHGVTLGNLSVLTSDELEVYHMLPRNVTPSVCVLKALTPGNIRNLMDTIVRIGSEDGHGDMLKYIGHLNDLLCCFTHVGLLSRPHTLVYPRKLRVYKRSKERCTRGR